MNIKNKRKMKKLFAIISLIVAVGSSLSPATANAGLLQWLSGQSGSTNALTESANYAGITLALAFPDKNSNAWDGAFIGGNSISEKRSQATVRATRPTSAKTYIVEASGYSSTHDQTDDTPFITASGTYVRDGVVAANFLPIGTVIKIPDLYGNKTFVVEDRMN